ncbi:MAG: competence protein ComEC [Polaribacter sp.]|jgi:competence protein ComEC
MKRLLNFLPTHFTVCLIVGIILQFHYKLWILNSGDSMLFLFFLLLVLFFLKRFKKQLLFTILSWLLFVLMGMFVVASQDSTTKKEFYNTYSPSDSLATFKVHKVLKKNLYYDKYIGEVIKVGSVNSTGDILLNIQRDSTTASAKINDLFYFKAAFVVVENPKNPYQFKYKNYLEKQGVYHQVFLRNTAYVHKESSQSSIYKIAESIRDTIEHALRLNGFKGEELEVIKALILGQRNNISKELLQEYTKAGAIHILAVSGLHVGVILLILTALFKPLDRLKNGKLIKTILIVFMLWGFATIAGLSASVVRAVTMFSAVAIGMTFDRKTFVIHSLITSMFLLLLVKPMFLFDVGFQLSYLAVFSIVTIQPKLADLWKPKWKLVDKIWQLFSVSIAAQIGVLPISVFYFHQFPGLFMVSNLVIIPFIGVILMGGILIIFLSLLNMLPKFIGELYNGIISLMNDFVGWISIQESFLITEISFSVSLLISSYFCVFLGIYLLEKSSFRKWVFFLLAVISVQTCLLYEKNSVENRSEIVVFNKSRHTIVGENKNGFLTVYHSLDTVSIRNLGALKDYKVGAKVRKVSYKNEIPSLVKFNNEYLLVVDSLGVYGINGIENPIVLLRTSPKINLERLLKVLKPKHIVADASNYKSHVLNWKFICDKSNIPFTYTQEDGAFILK